MSRQVRIDIKGKDEFWGRAFHVEWQDQFPERKLSPDEAGYYLADEDWLEDVDRVAAQTFCRVLRAPDRPERRRWIRALVPPRPRR